MKPVLFIFFGLMLFYLPLNAQLKVDAGNDIIVCASYNEEYKDIKLGGCPAASGGIEPYSYTWSGKLSVYPKANIWVFASEVLEDSTRSNPILKRDPPENWMTLYLTVRDAENNIGIDSVKIRRSYFIINLTGPYHETIKRGDSVALHGDYLFTSNFEPFEYYITPSHGLSDSTDVLGWAKPDTSILYYLYVINTIGCVSRKVQYLRVEVVDTATVVNNEFVNPELQCYFDHNDLILNWLVNNNSPHYITITTVTGQIIHRKKYNTKYLRLSGLGLQKNTIYIAAVTCHNRKKVFKIFNQSITFQSDSGNDYNYW